MIWKQDVQSETTITIIHLPGPLVLFLVVEVVLVLLLLPDPGAPPHLRDRNLSLNLRWIQVRLSPDQFSWLRHRNPNQRIYLSPLSPWLHLVMTMHRVKYLAPCSSSRYVQGHVVVWLPLLTLRVNVVPPPIPNTWLDFPEVAPGSE